MPIPGQWYNLPVVDAGPKSTDNTDVDEWKFISQFWKAAEERANLTGLCFWPPQGVGKYTNIWESGVVSATMGETSFRDVTKTWFGGRDDSSGISYANPFLGVISDSGNADFPTTWWLVIDDNDYEKTIVVPLSGWNNDGTLFYPNLRDFFTSRQLTSPPTTTDGDTTANLQSLSGKNYYIMGWPWGLWRSQRVLEWPNDTEFFRGTIQTLTVDTDPFSGATLPASPANNLIRDPNANWKINEHQNREMLVRANDGFLKRVTITSNTRTVLNFATKTWLPTIGAQYNVVIAERRAYPGRDFTFPYTWYRGRRDGYSSHSPTDDTIGQAGLPTGQFLVPGHQAGSSLCGGRDEQLWDNDFITDFPVDDNDYCCGRPPNMFYAPDYWKTIRGIHAFIEGICTNFVENKGYSTSSYMPFLNPAELFRVCGINSFTGTTGAVPGGSNNTIAINAGIVFPAAFTFPRQVWYSIRVPGWMDTTSGTPKWNQAEYKWGRGYMPNATTLVDQSFDNVFSTTGDGVTSDYPGDNGQTIYISPGWDVYYPLAFKRKYPIDGIFEPDIFTDPVTGEQNPIDPPAVTDFATTGCDGVGKFYKRGASTNYVNYRQQTQTYTDPQGFAWENGRAFASGDLALYEGDNWKDPSIYSGSSTGSGGYSQFFKNGSGAMLDKYYDRAFVGGQSRTNQNYSRTRGQLVGETTHDGTTTCLRDNTKNWFNHQFFNAFLRYEQGTATSGNLLSFSDNTKTPASGASNCFWQASRFVGFSSSYAGFPVEILFGTIDWNDTVNGIIEARQITVGSESAVSGTWVGNLVNGSASGRPYRIAESSILNRWIGRSLKLTNPSGATATVTITGNSAQWLFFTAAPFACVKGTQYEIIDERTNTVWKWDGTKWIAPTGTDVHRLAVVGPGVNFPKDQSTILPTYVKDYGRYMVGDMIGSELFNQIKTAFGALAGSKFSISWYSPTDPTELNYEMEGVSGYNAWHLTPPGGPCTLDPNMPEDPRDAVGALWGSNRQNGGVTKCMVGAPFALASYSFSKFTSPPSPCGPHDGCNDLTVERMYSYATIEGLCTRQPYAIDFYVLALCADCQLTHDCSTGYEDFFDANGDPVTYNTWSNFASLGSGLRSTAQVKLGSMGLPNEPGLDGVTCFRALQGYAVVDAAAIVWGTNFNYGRAGSFGGAAHAAATTQKALPFAWGLMDIINLPNSVP